MIADLREILRTPYDLDGDTVGIGLSCFGAVRAVARLRGIPRPPDGWESIRAAWLRGDVETASGFPEGWRRHPGGTTIEDGDVLVYMRDGRPGCAIVHNGAVVTANPERGVHRVPLDRWRTAPSEVWRWQP